MNESICNVECTFLKYYMFSSPLHALLTIITLFPKMRISHRERMIGWSRFHMTSNRALLVLGVYDLGTECQTLEIQVLFLTRKKSLCKR